MISETKPVPVYDPTIIEEFAAKLYEQASQVVPKQVTQGIFGGLFLGLILGATVAFVSRFFLTGRSPEEVLTNDLLVSSAAMVVCGVLGGFLGYASGKEKAFALRLKAQQALCQVQIEKNTRGKSEPENSIRNDPFGLLRPLS